MNLTTEQQNIVKQIVIDIKKEKKQEITFSGAAGTGKTTCISYLTEIFPGFDVCAYTGKACDVLRKKGMSASTIHSLIYKPIKNLDGSVEFILKDKSELFCDGFIVDEASMVSSEIYDDMIQFGKPIIFVGDHNQLEPIGNSINLMADPMYKLETVHRNAGEIAHFADHIRKGNSPTSFNASGKVIFAEPKQINENIIASVDQMICAYNKTRVQKNEEYRQSQGFTQLIEPGERIICLRNNKKMGLFNGMQGKVSKLSKNCRLNFQVDDMEYLDVQYDVNQFGQEKNQFDFDPDGPNPFDYAYCITCHKSQGSEFDNLMVFEQECQNWDHKRWMYTSASRAKNSLIWVSYKKYRPSWL